MSETPKIIETPPIKKEPKTPEIETNTEKQHSIEDLKIPEKNAVLKNIVDWFSSYIENELKTLWLNTNQLNNIKLTILSDILDKLNWNWKINITKSINDLIKKIPYFLKAKKDEEKNENSAVKTFLESLWLVNIKNIINNKLTQIKEETDKTKFNNLKSSFSSLWLPEKTFLDIQWQISKANKNSNKVSEALDTANEIWFWWKIWEIINYLMESFPFLASILWAFQSQFEKWWNSEKTKKSVSNLQTFLEKSKEKSPLDKIEENENFKDKDKLNPEKLEKFYKYLDIKDIDYSKENFWEEFLSWNSKDVKIIELTKLLNFTQDIKLKWTQLKDIYLEDFIETLNNLWKIEDKKEKEDIKKHNTNIETQIEKAKKEWRSTIELEKQIRYTFEENLANNKIEVNWRLEDISIINNQIKIWENTYKISIMWNMLFMEKEFFESISLKDWTVTIKANWKIKIYNASEIKEILQKLVNSWKYSQKIPWKPATLTIKKV